MSEFSKRKNRHWEELGIDAVSGAMAFQSGHVRALRSRDEGRWHLSVSTAHRYPTWDEIADARYDLAPIDVEMAMFLPKPENYVNLHPFVFHLWEVRDEGKPYREERFGLVRTTVDGRRGAEHG